MFNMAAEKTVSLYLTFLIPFGALFLLTETVTDPVNVTKLAAIGTVGVALLLIFISFASKIIFREYRWYLCTIGVFVVAMLNAMVLSDAPFSQNFYGTYGRNTGFIAYFALSGVSLGALLLQDKSNFKRAIWGLQAVGIVNVFYCAWVLAFGDFIGWSNPYGNILGLFGNPNFVGAFLGIFISTLIAAVLGKGVNWGYRVIAALVAALAFYEILESNAIQGIVVTAVGGVIVGFYWIRSRFAAKWVTYSYTALTSLLGFVALMGALQKGPMSFIYKRSVSLRGSYWDAAISMGKEHPFSGVGLDSYGDFYRLERSVKAATTTPGVNTTTNAAHNVILDFFANGGWPLLITYVVILGFGAWAILRVSLRQREYDPIFVSMAAIWICYQVQSIISINQMGLAVWGWLFTGALLAYEFATREKEVQAAQATSRNSAKKGKSANNGIITPALVGGLGLVVGLILCVPPLSADTRWRSALSSQDATKVEAALVSGYLNPLSSQRFAEATTLFARNNLNEQALRTARKGVEFNKDYFNAWLLLWYLPDATVEEKAEALKNLKRLDPLNPDPTKQ
jgi:O-antigen ligase